MNLFSNQELIVMAIIVGILLVVIIYLTILDIKEYLKNKHFDEVSLDNLEIISDDMSDGVKNVPPAGSMAELFEEIEVIDLSEPSTTNVLIVDDEGFNISYSEVKVSNQEDEQSKAQEELARVELELSQIPNKDPFEDTITKFELEQEETAIISLDELSKVSDNLYDNNDMVQYDDGNEPITIDEVISNFNKASNPLEVNDKEEFIPSFFTTYKGSHEMQFENTANYDKLELAMRSNNDFLNTLKEMHEKHEN